MVAHTRDDDLPEGEHLEVKPDGGKPQGYTPYTYFGYLPQIYII